MKKWLCVLLALTLTALLFAGCGGGTPTNNNGGNESKPAGQETQSGERPVITIGLCQNTRVEDYEDNAFTRYLEEQTGYKIKFDYLPVRQDDAKTTLTTRFAGGEKLPDIIYRVAISGYKTYGREGYIVDLKDYFYDDADNGLRSDKAKNFWNLFDQLPELDQETAIRKMIDSEDGSMYVLPRLETSPVDTMWFHPYINQTWLNKLGLKMPTNADELYDVLVAFRDKDPDGNGVNDQIPLLGINNALGGKVLDWLINMYTYHDPNHVWNVDSKGKLYCSATTESYRKGLQYANKLYREGLLSSSSFTIERQSMQSLTTPPAGQECKVGVFVGHLTLHVELHNMNLKNYVAMEIFSNAIRKENSQSFDTFITKDCADPSGAFDFLMACYTEEAALRNRYGERGVDFVEADPGAVSFVGFPATIKVLNTGAFEGNTTSTWGTIGPTILINAENEQVQMDENEQDEWALYKMTIFKKLVENFQKRENEQTREAVNPGILHYSEDDATTTDQIRNNCGNFITTSKSAFIRGDKGFDPNNDSDWNKYLNDLKSYGLDDWQELAQRYYNDAQK